MIKKIKFYAITVILFSTLIEFSFADSNVSTLGNFQSTAQLNGTCQIRVSDIHLGLLDAINRNGTYENNGIATGPSSKIEYLCSKGVIGNINYTYSDPAPGTASKFEIRPWGAGYLIGQTHGEKIAYTIDNLYNENRNNVAISGNGQWKDWNQESGNNVILIKMDSPVPDTYIGTVIININY